MMSGFFKLFAGNIFTFLVVKIHVRHVIIKIKLLFVELGRGRYENALNRIRSHLKLTKTFLDLTMSLILLFFFF